MKGKKFMVQRYKEIMVSIVLLPLILIVLWNETVMKVWKKLELMLMRYEGKY